MQQVGDIGMFRTSVNKNATKKELLEYIVWLKLCEEKKIARLRRQEIMITELSNVGINLSKMVRIIGDSFEGLGEKFDIIGKRNKPGGGEWDLEKDLLDSGVMKAVGIILFSSVGEALTNVYKGKLFPEDWAECVPEFQERPIFNPRPNFEGNTEN